MISIEERNRFIMQNYQILARLTLRCARRVQLKFGSLSIRDLASYAFEGIIDALDKVIDPKFPDIYPYLAQYGYLRALSGAMVMLGISRDRTKDKTAKSPTLVPCDPLEIRDFIESQQFLSDINNNTEDEFLTKQEREWFLSLLKGTVEFQILREVFRRQNANNISHRFNIPVRKVRKYAVNLNYLFEMAKRNRPLHYCSVTLLDLHKMKIIVHKSHISMKPWRKKNASQLSRRQAFTTSHKRVINTVSICKLIPFKKVSTL